MNTRRIDRLVPAMATSDGAGVSMHRAIGTQALANLDPFLMLDYFGSDDPEQYIAGFPDHPHRGFITLTYMLDGHMQHQDSMGNQGDLGPGGIQWMKAASGVIHSEMPRQSNGLMRGFQLWINLPASEKMSAPAYQEFAADAVPVINSDGALVKLIAGSIDSATGPIRDAITNLTYADVTLAAQATFEHKTVSDATVFVFMFEGSGSVDTTVLEERNLGVMSPGDTISLTAGDKGARFVVVGGNRIGEPIAQHGPFVMNTREELTQAFDDYQNGTLVRSKATVNQSV